MTRSSIHGLLAVAAVAGALTGGCATRGFVRSEIASVRQEHQQDTQEMRTELNLVRNSTNEALARAETALEISSDSRALALGKMGFREVDRYIVEFPFDSDQLTDDARASLDGVAQRVVEQPTLLVDVYGFTDATGPNTYNLQLGQRRADAVVRYLADLTPGQLRRYAAVSYGESKPVASDMDSGAHARNRRAVVALIERVPLDESGDVPEPVTILQSSAEM